MPETNEGAVVEFGGSIKTICPHCNTAELEIKCKRIFSCYDAEQVAGRIRYVFGAGEVVKCPSCGYKILIESVSPEFTLTFRTVRRN